MRLACDRRTLVVIFFVHGLRATVAHGAPALRVFQEDSEEHVFARDPRCSALSPRARPAPDGGAGTRGEEACRDLPTRRPVAVIHERPLLQRASPQDEVGLLHHGTHHVLVRRRPVPHWHVCRCGGVRVGLRVRHHPLLPDRPVLQLQHLVPGRCVLGRRSLDDRSRVSSVGDPSPSHALPPSLRMPVPTRSSSHFCVARWRHICSGSAPRY
jgi:hypothetical protein